MVSRKCKGSLRGGSTYISGGGAINTMRMKVVRMVHIERRKIRWLKMRS